MDIMKIIQLGIDYLSDYFMDLVLILKNPKIRFHPVLETKSVGDLVLTDASPRYKETKLNPKIFGFMAISIFIGSLFISLFPTYTNLPNTNFLALSTTTHFYVVEPPSTVELIVLTIANWFFSAMIVYLVCVLLRVKVNFWDFSTVFLQLQASIYLVSNFVAFLWTMVGNSIVKILGLVVVNDIISATLQNPAMIYYSTHLILTLIYVPLALSSLYRANPLKLVIIALVPAIWLTLFLLPSISGQWVWVAYCEQCKLEAELQLLQELSTLLPASAIEQYHREATIKLLSRITLGILLSITFIFAILMGRKRLRSKYSI